MFRTTIKTLALSIAVFAGLAASPEKRRSEKEALAPGVELSCMLTYQEKSLDNYTIIVCREDKPADSITVSDPEGVFFRLDYGHQYAVIHRAKGFRDRIVMVNTELSADIRMKKRVFDYEIEMIRNDKPSNTLYDLPVAVVRYDASSGKFDYSREYQKQVRK